MTAAEVARNRLGTAGIEALAALVEPGVANAVLGAVQDSAEMHRALDHCELADRLTALAVNLARTRAALQDALRYAENV